MTGVSRGRPSRGLFPRSRSPGRGGPPPIILPSPVLLDSFDSATGFSVVNASAPVVDTANKRQGTGSLAVTGAGATGSAYVTKTTAAQYTPALLRTLVALIYIGTRGNQISCSAQFIRAANGIQITVSDSAAKSRIGWRAVAINALDPTGSQAWRDSAAGTLQLRPKFDSTLANTTAGNFDAMYCQADGFPTYCATFDDAEVEQYTVVFPLFKSLRLRGVLFIPAALVGGVGKLTWAMIREMRDAGWQIAIDSTPDDTATSTIPSVVVAGLDAQRATLAANGALDGKGGEFYLCWTFGLLPAEDVLAAVEAAGYKLARGVEPGINYTRMGFLDQRLALYAQGFSNTSTTATFDAFYDKAKLVGATFVTLTHGCNDAGGAIDMPYTACALPSWTKVASDIARGQMLNLTLQELDVRDGANTPP